MATSEENWFEVERRVIMFKPTTTLPDATLLGYDGDPNNVINGNTQGETLLYNCPMNTRYSQSIGVEWRKQSVPNTWVLIGEGSSSTCEVTKFIATFWDPNLGLPPSPVEGDIFVALYDHSGWTKNNLYKYELGAFVEIIAQEGFCVITPKGEIHWFKLHKTLNYLCWICEGDINDRVLNNIGTGWCTDLNFPHQKLPSAKKVPITHREQGRMFPESIRYFFELCTIREYFKIHTSPGSRIIDWVDLILDPTFYGAARPHFYINSKCFTKLPLQATNTLSNSRIISFDKVTKIYTAKLEGGSLPTVTGSNGYICAIPDNGDKPRSISYVNDLGSDLFEISFHMPSPKQIFVSTWQVGDRFKCMNLFGDQFSWQPIFCLGTGWNVTSRSHTYRKAPKPFYKSLTFPELEDPGAFPNIALFEGSSYTERTPIKVSIDLHRSHVPILVKTKRIKDIIWHNTDGGDFPQFVIETQHGLLEYPCCPKLYWRGIPNVSSMQGSSMIIRGIARVRFTDPLNDSGGDDSGGDWLWHGSQVRTLLITYELGGLLYSRFINLPVGLEVVVPKGYYPLMIENPNPISTMSHHWNTSNQIMKAGKVKNSYGYVLNTNHPTWSLGDDRQMMDNNNPLQNFTNQIFISINTRLLAEGWSYKKRNIVVRFIAINRKGYLSENSDSFKLMKFSNFFGYDTDIPIIQRVNNRC